MIVYLSIGNSDDKLPQQDWASYQARFLNEVRQIGVRVHGVWYSSPAGSYQNMCICAEVRDDVAAGLRAALTQARKEFGQDAVAWAQAPVTEMI